jgi:hypothetical protein
MKTLIVAFALIFVPSITAAQNTGTVKTNAPIFVTSTPGVNAIPLRVAAVGTVLNVIGGEGDWLQVQFQDPRWGQRTGWVDTKHVRISHPNLDPIDLSIRDTPANEAAASRMGVGTAQAGTSTQNSVGIEPRQRDPLARNPMSGRPQTREGLWFNVGLGLGSQGCQDCLLRDNGLSGGLSVGGRISDRVLLGVGTAGWAKEIAGETLSVGTLDARLRFYPARTSGFFLTGGLGIGSLSYAGESEFGLGAILGLGWDIRVGRNISLTPFYNGFAMSNSLVDANVGQFGIGVTIH